MKLTKAQKRELEPFVAAYQRMVEQIQGMDDDGLYALRDAAEAHGQTNCWFRAYDAAQVVKSLIAHELVDREFSGRAALSHPTPTAGGDTR